MVHRGKRSPKSTLKRYMWKTSFQDWISKEVICTITPSQATTYLIKLTTPNGDLVYPTLNMSTPHSITRGEVIQDPRGMGTSQQQIGIFQKNY